MAKIEVTTRVTGINYTATFFSFFINRNITINTYFIKMLLKTILIIHTQEWTQLLKEVSEQNVSLAMRQRRFGATFQCAT